MAKTIFKYCQGDQVPRGAIPLAAQIQDGVVQAWCIVDSDERVMDRRVVVIPTGGALFDSASKDNYVGTFQAGWFVGHVFLKPEGE